MMKMKMLDDIIQQKNIMHLKYIFIWKLRKTHNNRNAIRHLSSSRYLENVRVLMKNEDNWP